MKFIIIIMLGFASAGEYIKMERKWAKFAHTHSHFHQECQEQYDEYLDICPPNWVVEHEYLNVQGGAVQGNQVVLNCEKVVLCKVQTSK